MKLLQILFIHPSGSSPVWAPSSQLLYNVLSSGRAWGGVGTEVRSPWEAPPYPRPWVQRGGCRRGTAPSWGSASQPAGENCSWTPPVKQGPALALSAPPFDPGEGPQRAGRAGRQPPASPRLRLDIFRLHSPTGIFLVGRNGMASGFPVPAAAVSCPSPLKSGPWASLPLSQTPGHMAARAAYHRPRPTMLQRGAEKGPLDPKGVPSGGSTGAGPGSSPFPLRA